MNYPPNPKSEPGSNATGSDFFSALIKLLSHPLAAGISGYIISQLLHNKTPDVNAPKTNKSLNDEVSSIKAELRAIKEQLKQMQQYLLTSPNVADNKLNEPVRPLSMRTKNYPQLD